MATTDLASHRHLINAHLEPLATSTPVPYSRRLPPMLAMLGSRGNSRVDSHRQRIVKEIFDTEHNYISQLNTIVSRTASDPTLEAYKLQAMKTGSGNGLGTGHLNGMFLKPIRVGCLLPCDATNTIFSNVEGILSVNVELFTCMRQRSLGEAFSYLGPFLKLYSTYANNFQNASQTLQEWTKRSPDFTHFVVSQESRPECCGLTLPALLITPIQRIPRYKLLLQDLLKHTKSTHPDYSKLNAASTQIAAVASHINEHIRQHDNFKKMLAIQNSLTGQCIPGILAPGRKFLQEGRLMKVCRRKPKERMVFLFSDMLIYARPNLLEKMETTRTYECRCVLPLLNSTVRVVLGDSKVPSSVGALFKVSNADTSLLFFSHKQEEVFHWAQAIEDAIRNLQLAFGSLMNSNRALVHAGDTVENPLLNIANHDSLPASPYPLTSTLISPQVLSAKTRKVDSGFSEQHGTVTTSENLECGSAGGNSIVRETTDRHLHSQQSDGMNNLHQNGKRPNSSNKVGSETVTILRRPHTAGAALGHIDAGSCGTHEDMGQQRKKKIHNPRVKGHHHSDCEGVVLVNEHVLEGMEEEEEEVEVPDESVGLAVATSGAIPQPHHYQPISAESGTYVIYPNTVRSRCCTIL